MDELTIDDKKYVSSKRAAQITGYAKDYIGQLCREGYVEAKRVGRSWYVLEAAIKDHRFGGEPRKDEKPAKPTAASTSGFTIVHEDNRQDRPVSAASAPRYEALEPPSINLLRKDELQAEEPVQQEAVPIQDFHAAWQGWFDAFHTPQEPQEDPVTTPISDVPMPDAAAQTLSKEEVAIPIHHLAPQESPIIAPLPLRIPQAEVLVEDAMHQPARPIAVPHRGVGVTRVLLSAFFIVVSVLSMAIALFGSGYLDKSLISIERAQIIDGISIVNK